MNRPSLAYRQNYTLTAKAWCQRCLAFAGENPPRAATAYIIQAMACQRLGETDMARMELAQSRNLIAAEFSKGLEEGTGGTGWWYD